MILRPLLGKCNDDDDDDDDDDDGGGGDNDDGVAYARSTLGIIERDSDATLTSDFGSF